MQNDLKIPQFLLTRLSCPHLVHGYPLTYYALNKIYNKMAKSSAHLYISMYFLTKKVLLSRRRYLLCFIPSVTINMFTTLFKLCFNQTDVELNQLRKCYASFLFVNGMSPPIPHFYLSFINIPCKPLINKDKGKFS